MAMGSSQKFIARNRAPRVQIEYDTEVYGAKKKVSLPFVMAVLADLKGKPSPDDPEKPMDEREFEAVDARALAITLISATLMLLGNILSDVLVAISDPRVSFK